MEKILNDRLEKEDVFTSIIQNRYRSGRSRNDNIVSLVKEIYEAFACGQKLVTVFFDIVKAYDTTFII